MRRNFTTARSSAGAGNLSEIRCGAKAELRFYGIHLEESRGRWTQIYFETLRSIKFENHWMKESFNRLLELYEFLSGQIDKQTQLFRELSETPLYQERVDEEIFSFIHGSHERGCLFYLEQSIG